MEINENKKVKESSKEVYGRMHVTESPIAGMVDGLHAALKPSSSIALKYSKQKSSLGNYYEHISCFVFFTSQPHLNSSVQFFQLILASLN